MGYCSHFEILFSMLKVTVLFQSTNCCICVRSTELTALSLFSQGLIKGSC